MASSVTDLLYYNKSLELNLINNFNDDIKMYKYTGVTYVDLVFANVRFNSIKVPEYTRKVNIKLKEIIERYSIEDEVITLVEDVSMLARNGLFERLNYDLLNNDGEYLSFLHSRGVTEDDIVDHCLGSTRNLTEAESKLLGLKVHSGIRTWVGHERINGIIQPIISNGITVGAHVRCLNTLPKIKFISTTPRAFVYNIDKAVKSEKNYIVIVEGIFDQITMQRAGYDNVVHLCNAMPSAMQLAIIFRKCIDNNKKVVTFQDSDGVGVNAQVHTLSFFKNLALGGVILPEGYKDPDEYYRSKGPLDIEELMVPYVTLEDKLKAIINRGDNTDIDFDDYINNRKMVGIADECQVK